MNTATATTWTPDARSALVAASIQRIKARIQQLTWSYNEEQYWYAMNHIRYSEAKQDRASAPATSPYSLRLWENYGFLCPTVMQDLVHEMGVLERKWKDQALMEEDRVARAVGRIEEARRKRERDGEEGPGERAGKRRGGNEGAVLVGVEVEGAD